MSYAKRAKINWAKALAHPRDYELLQMEKARNAHANAWKESSNESDGRVVYFAGVGGAATMVVGYDHRAEMISVTAPSNNTLRIHATKARHNRAQAGTRGINRHAAGN